MPIAQGLSEASAPRVLSVSQRSWSSGSGPSLKVVPTRDFWPRGPGCWTSTTCLRGRRSWQWLGRGDPVWGVFRRPSLGRGYGFVRRLWHRSTFSLGALRQAGLTKEGSGLEPSSPFPKVASRAPAQGLEARRSRLQGRDHHRPTISSEHAFGHCWQD